ncbi:MAG: MarR family transcriptional regulator [Acidimicrobiaceae bacterium]|nr:MarR family transcriptional regulator [Acidimicrobiaceae bacterium]
MVKSKVPTKNDSDSATLGPTYVRLSELVVKAARKFRRNFSIQLAPLGVTFAQAQVLRIVARADIPLRMVDIAARLDIVPRSATTKIDALQALGFVERLSNNADRRSIPIAVTDKGREVLDRLDDVRRATAEELFSDLTEPDRQELSRLLNVVCSTADSRVGNPLQGGGGVGSVPMLGESHNGSGL